MEDGTIISKTGFARRCGVTQACVSKWLREGMIGPEALLGNGRHARIRVEPALEMLRSRLDRSRLGSTANLGGEAVAGDRSKFDLIAAKTNTANLHRQLLEIKLARVQGELIPLAAARASSEAAGRAVGRALEGIVGWGEELLAAGQIGGLAALSARLRVLSAELRNSVADMLMAEAEDCGRED